MRELIYPRRQATADSYRYTVRSQTGSLFSARTSDQVGYPFAVHGYFNWRNIAIAREVCRPGDTIVEVGANIGSETIGFSDVVGADGVVHAFEPFPSNIDQLRANAAQTTHHNITVHPLALASRAGDTSFLAPEVGNSGSGHLDQTGCADGRVGRTVVACTTLDTIMAQVGRPRLLAIDAEGYEGAILRGGRAFLRANRPVIVLEVLERLLRRADDRPQDIAALLEGLDYDVYEITRFGLKAIDTSTGKVPAAADWLALAGEPQTAKRVRRTLVRCATMPLIASLNPLRR